MALAVASRMNSAVDLRASGKRCQMVEDFNCNRRFF